MEARFSAGHAAWFDFIADALAGPLAEAGAGGVRGALIARALVGAVVQVARLWASDYRE